MIFAEIIDKPDTEATSMNVYVKYMLDLRQDGITGKDIAGGLVEGGGPGLFYAPAFGYGGKYSAFFELRTSLGDFEIKFSKLYENKFESYYISEKPIFFGFATRAQVIDCYPNAYLKYSKWDWYIAFGMLQTENSAGRFFTLPDIFFIDKQFDFLDGIRAERSQYNEFNKLNIGYSNGIITFNCRIFPVEYSSYSEQSGYMDYSFDSYVIYSSLEYKIKNLKLSIYGSYDANLWVNGNLPQGSDFYTTFLGANTSVKLGDQFSFYLETRTKRIMYWPIYLETVLGIKYLENNGYSAIVENYYATYDIYKVFIEGEKKDVFGWDGWDADITFLYSPSEPTNFKTYFTVRRNWSKNWLSEFRYGYESIGNHIVDVSIRLYDM